MKRTLAVLLTIAMCMAMVAGLGVAAAEEPTTVRGWGAFSFNDQTGITGYEQQLAWQQIEQRLGIKVEWTTVSGVDRETQFSLVMASGDLPDFFVDINPLFFEEFGRKGALIALNDVIEGMPNLQALLALDDEALPSITSADGNIFFLPRLLEPATRYWPGLFIRKDYLEQVGLGVPTTTEEYKAALIAVKAGVEKCTMPLTGDQATLKTLVWPFGVGSRGTGTGNTDDAFIDNGAVAYGPTDSRYREALTYISGLYAEGLIEPEWNSGNQARTNIVTGASASTAGSFSGVLSTYNGLLVADGQGEVLTYVKPLIGPAGVQTWQGHHTSIDLGYGMAITSTSKKVDTVAKLFDYTYGDEGRELIYWGVEGETFQVADGERTFTEKVASSPLGVLTYLNNYSANTSCYPSALILKFYHATLSPIAREGNLAETELGQAYDIRMPAVRYTEDESAEVNTILADLNPYVDENFAAFVTGRKDISSDAEWESYVAGFSGLRLDELMGYYSDAYARFVANKK
ncbi:MAG TPA: extracellular solute-binding protein [Clostridia bacterium]|nr:extracellular solute-binding protein [Clostridia bacterium]